MSAETGAWMPMYWADYLADTQHLTAEEHGTYILLIATYWRRGSPLPDDDKFLANVAKTNRQRWAQLRKSIGPLFIIRGGAWEHKRLEIEILKSSERLNSARANGRAGGLAKSKLVTVTTTEERKKELSLRESTPQPKRKSRLSLPENFPDEVSRKWSETLWLSKGRADLCDSMDDEAAKFRDYHNANAKPSADWAASWRTWAKNAMNFTRSHRNGNGKLTGHQAFAAAALSIVRETEDRSRQRNLDDVGTA